MDCVVAFATVATFATFATFATVATFATFSTFAAFATLATFVAFAAFTAFAAQNLYVYYQPFSCRFSKCLWFWVCQKWAGLQSTTGVNPLYRFLSKCGFSWGGPTVPTIPNSSSLLRRNRSDDLSADGGIQPGRGKVRPEPLKRGRGFQVDPEFSVPLSLVNAGMIPCRFGRFGVSGSRVSFRGPSMLGFPIRVFIVLWQAPGSTWSGQLRGASPPNALSFRTVSPTRQSGEREALELMEMSLLWGLKLRGWLRGLWPIS